MSLWPLLHSSPKGLKVDADNLCRVSSHHLNAVVCHPYVIGSIPVLIVPTSPAYITRFIVAVVVYTFKSHTVRSFAHICKEIFKRKPSFADIYSPPTISMIGDVVFIKAPRLHISPCAVRWGVTTRPCSSVFLRSSSHGDMATGVRTEFSPATGDKCRNSIEGFPTLLASAVNSLCRMGFCFSRTGTRTKYPRSSRCRGWSYLPHKRSAAYKTGTRNLRHSITSIMVYNHCRELGNKVIEVLLSAAKPIREDAAYHNKLRLSTT